MANGNTYRGADEARSGGVRTDLDQPRPTRKGLPVQPEKNSSRNRSLSNVVARYLGGDSRSLNRIAQEAQIDVAYLHRLRTGERQHPSRDVLIRLGLVLELEVAELDELLVTAEFAPISSRRI